jgi:hypothetical protein
MSTPQQAMFFFFSFYTYLLIVSLQIANKYGIKKKLCKNDTDQT